MNVENILKVADAIENHTISELGFNMKTYFDQVYVLFNEEFPHANIDKSGNHCGTVACIAGWAICVLKKTTSPKGCNFRIEATELFGISENLGEKLFIPDHNENYEIDSFQAARTLRHFVDTGEIDFAIGADVKTDQTSAEF